MSIRLRATTEPLFEDTESCSSDEDEEKDEETWEDWISDSNQSCKSLFEPEKSLENAEKAIEFDREKFGFDLNQFCKTLSLDVHGRIRLVNFIRKTKPSVQDVLQITGKEDFFNSDDYLKPVIEDDPLLQLQSDDWSDSEDDDNPHKRIKSLQSDLSQTRSEFQAYRSLINQRLNLLDSPADTTVVGQPKRDDDSHYFQSYDAHDIHAVMIQDKIRTSTYARYILQSPHIFENATVLDVGCGTGILSLFAARAGAKKVIAVDASDIAIKAEKIVEANDLQAVITVVHGKVEDIDLTELLQHSSGKVDVIISEWMGYALLYESMLDSVLVARDRFLKPGGVLAPSQCKMMLAICDAGEILKDRVTFWGDVYGFDLSIMSRDLYGEGIVDVLGPDTMLSEPFVVKDIYIPTTTPASLSFTSSFRLVSTADRRSRVSAFVLYFDTFFASSGERVPPGVEVEVVRVGEAQVAEVWPVGGKRAGERRASQCEVEERRVERRKSEAGRPPIQRRKSSYQLDVISFSTGPKSVPTHWKQTVFLVREPFSVEEGTTVVGQFCCRKSDENSRELDIEIRYSVRAPSDSTDDIVEGEEVVIQMYKVR
ncbi:S-adenosyl-L-methionine-dependent methyltransferase [Marasmius fiardii PR-910]|nr:S-adenosyl-L-methionine-dependent methyltransferase [Marasmius fiardii PR-910]